MTVWHGLLFLSAGLHRARMGQPEGGRSRRAGTAGTPGRLPWPLRRCRATTLSVRRRPVPSISATRASGTGGTGVGLRVLQSAQARQRASNEPCPCWIPALQQLVTASPCQSRSDLASGTKADINRRLCRIYHSTRLYGSIPHSCLFSVQHPVSCRCDPSY